MKPDQLDSEPMKLFGEQIWSVRMICSWINAEMIKVNYEGINKYDKWEKINKHK